MPSEFYGGVGAVLYGGGGVTSYGGSGVASYEGGGAVGRGATDDLDKRAVPPLEVFAGAAGAVEDVEGERDSPCC